MAVELVYLHEGQAAVDWRLDPARQAVLGHRRTSGSSCSPKQVTPVRTMEVTYSISR